MKNVLTLLFVLIASIGACAGSYDSSTGAVMSVEYEHHEIHAGSFFRAERQADLGNAASTTLVITTPNTTKWLHFRPALDLELEGTIEIYENPTTVSSGTAIIPHNANRNSPALSAATVLVDPIIDLASATLIEKQVLGSGKSSGGDSDSMFEWVLKQNETYVIRITNNTTSNNQINLRCQWYEHTNR